MAHVPLSLSSRPCRSSFPRRRSAPRPWSSELFGDSGKSTPLSSLSPSSCSCRREMDAVWPVFVGPSLFTQGVLLSRSSFAARFSCSLEALLDWLLNRIIKKTRKDVVPVRQAVGGFDDIIAVDSSVAKVADALRSVWKGTRENSAAAALKIHTFNRALTGELLRYRLTAETVTAEASEWGPGSGTA